MKRGDVVSCRFEPVEGSEQGGTRPALIVSRDSVNETRGTVIVVPITSNLARRAPYHAFLPAGEGGLRVDSVALGDQIRAVAKSRIGRRWGSLSQPSLQSVDQALRVALNI